MQYVLGNMLNGGGGISKRITSVAFVGDSISTYHFDTTNFYFDATGYAAQARAHASSRFDFVRVLVAPTLPSGTLSVGSPGFAVSGTRTNYHLANLIPLATASNAGAVVILSGTNNFGQSEESQTLTDIGLMIDAVKASGKYCVVLPLLGPITANSKATFVATTNSGIASLCASKNVGFADYRPYTEASDGVSLSTMTADNLHPNQLSASFMGRAVADVLAQKNLGDVSTPYFNRVGVTMGEVLTSEGLDPNWGFESWTGTIPNGYSIGNIGTGPTITHEKIAEGSRNAWRMNISENSSTGQIRISRIIRSNSGTAQDGTQSSITLASGASGSNSFYSGSRIFITSGAGAGQTRIITSYNGTTKVANISPDWVVQPDSTSVYQLGFRSGERVQILVDLDIDGSSAFKGIGCLIRMTTPTTNTYGGDIYSGGATQTISASPIAVPNRRMILRGSDLNVLPSNIADGGNGQVYLYLSGSGIVTIRRFAAVAIDRTPGMLTF
jgi:lysophospholipase L1-like esterase